MNRADGSTSGISSMAPLRTARVVALARPGGMDSAPWGPYQCCARASRFWRTRLQRRITRPQPKLSSELWQDSHNLNTFRPSSFTTCSPVRNFCVNLFSAACRVALCGAAANGGPVLASTNPAAPGLIPLTAHSSETTLIIVFRGAINSSGRETRSDHTQHFNPRARGQAAFGLTVHTFVRVRFPDNQALGDHFIKVCRPNLPQKN